MANFGGIEKIKIPVSKGNLYTENDFKTVMLQYLNICLNAHSQNIAKIKGLKEFYLGNQGVLEKKRPYTDDGNNIIVENHAKRQVDFKVDFLLGDKMQLSHKSGQCNDDLHIFDRFLTDSGFHTEFREIKKDAYMLGVGVSFAQPRTDIIDENGEYYPEYDKDTESPFLIKCVSPINNFVVYSSDVFENPLFAVNISNQTNSLKNPFNVSQYQITVYSEKYVAIYSAQGNPQVISNSAKPDIKEQKLRAIPIIEHTFNKERIGIIETNKSLFNSINTVISNAADAVYDSVNKIFVFKNVDADDDTIKSMINSGAVAIETTNPETPADCTTLDVQFNQTDLNTFYEQRVSKAYDIAGVPLASGVTSSGGDTGKARLLGGGWENAYTIIKGDIIGYEKSDYALLKQLLAICHTVPDNKVDELAASQIEIHYNINPNDDILSKTQSISNLNAVGMPKELQLKYTNLSLDPCADAQKWEDNVKAESDLELQSIKESFVEESNQQKQNITVSEEETENV